MVGSHGCFETIEPERDVWGDNNDNMRTAFMVRIAESDKKSYAGKIGKVRTEAAQDHLIGNRKQAI